MATTSNYALCRVTPVCPACQKDLSLPLNNSRRESVVSLTPNEPYDAKCICGWSGKAYALFTAMRLAHIGGRL